MESSLSETGRFARKSAFEMKYPASERPDYKHHEAGDSPAS